MNFKEKLIQYRDLEVTKDELLRNNNKEIIEERIIVAAEHLINLLNKYKQNIIDLDKVIEWVNIVWFTEWFDYDEEQSESIASVMHELEELDEIGKVLTLNRVEQYIISLTNNEEL